MATAHNAAKAYPLQWPKGRERAAKRLVNSRFADRKLQQSLSALKYELKRLDAKYIVVSTNIPLKANGDPYSDPGRMPDPGVAVYFRLKDTPYALSCDRWVGVEDNLYAIAKHVEAMRGMERWGVGSVEQTFAGFMALTANTEENPWEVLGLEPMSPPAQIVEAHRKLARAAHPDKGGSQDQMARVNTARDAALRALDGDSK